MYLVIELNRISHDILLLQQVLMVVDSELRTLDLMSFLSLNAEHLLLYSDTYAFVIQKLLPKVTMTFMHLCRWDFLFMKKLIFRPKSQMSEKDCRFPVHFTYQLLQFSTIILPKIRNCKQPINKWNTGAFWFLIFLYSVWFLKSALNVVFSIIIMINGWIEAESSSYVLFSRPNGKLEPKLWPMIHFN